MYLAVGNVSSEESCGDKEIMELLKICVKFHYIVKKLLVFLKTDKMMTNKMGWSRRTMQWVAKTS